MDSLLKDDDQSEPVICITGALTCKHAEMASQRVCFDRKVLHRKERKHRLPSSIEHNKLGVVTNSTIGWLRPLRWYRI